VLRTIFSEYGRMRRRTRSPLARPVVTPMIPAAAETVPHLNGSIRFSAARHDVKPVPTRVED
jgi:hypothetical protein